MGKNAIVFNNILNKLQKHFFTILIVISIVGIVVIKLVSNVVVQHYNSKQVLDEMEFIASEQVSTINRAFDRNFIPLLFISDYLAKNGGFENNLNSDFLKAMMEGNDWSAIRFADLNGNSINQEGKDRGNVSDMPFFYEIARNGKPVAKITLINETPVSNRIGIAKGKFTIKGDFEADNDAIAESMMGGSL